MIIPKSRPEKQSPTKGHNEAGALGAVPVSCGRTNYRLGGSLTKLIEG
jgi:hypothetical protein